MPEDPEPQVLAGRSADEGLLDAGLGSLPSSIGRPVALPEKPGGSLLVAAGVAMGAVTLIGGIALAILGLVGLINGAGLIAVGELWAGILLAATHWGWIHVGAWSHDRLQGRRHGDVADDRHRWLESIEPYERYEVGTSVDEAGAITIETVCHRPAATDTDHFTFAPQQVAVEVHSADEPAADIAERAEHLRAQAAALTAQARARYEAAEEARHVAQLKGQDEQQQMAAARAASEALSDQLNAKLRDPPLVE